MQGESAFTPFIFLYQANNSLLVDLYFPSWVESLSWWTDILQINNFNKLAIYLVICVKTSMYVILNMYNFIFKNVR